MALAPLGCSKRAAAGSGKEAGVPTPARAARAVAVATAADQVMERTVAVIGSLAAHDEATLSVKVPGRLQTLAVDLGSSVRQGQLIAQVEPKDYELQLTQAEAFLSQARARLQVSVKATRCAPFSSPVSARSSLSSATVRFGFSICCGNAAAGPFFNATLGAAAG